MSADLADVTHARADMPLVADLETMIPHLAATLANDAKSFLLTTSEPSLYEHQLYRLPVAGGARVRAPAERAVPVVRFPLVLRRRPGVRRERPPLIATTQARQKPQPRAEPTTCWPS